MRFPMASHALPVEQGRLARPVIPWHLRCCSLCKTGHRGMKGILFLIAPILPTFAASLVHYIKVLMFADAVFSGTRIKRLSAIA